MVTKKGALGGKANVVTCSLAKSWDIGGDDKMTAILAPHVGIKTSGAERAKGCAQPTINRKKAESRGRGRAVKNGDVLGRASDSAGRDQKPSS